MFVEDIKELFASKGFKLLNGSSFLGRSGITTVTHEETKVMCVIKDEASKYNLYLYLHNPIYKNFKEQLNHGNPFKEYKLMDFIKILKEENSVSDLISKLAV